MSARVEAVAQAIAVYSDCDWELETGKAKEALAAADAVMFSEAAIERAAKVLNPRAWNESAVFLVPFGRTIEEVQRKDRDKARDQARAVVAALREEA